MKKAVSVLFLWGAMSLVRPLSADVVYHLSVLVDANLNDSIALVNLFPGNSSVSISNPSTGAREVFTVQQRTSIGRKIALPFSAANRLGFGDGSIAEVRIVELALDGAETSRELNPAAEYQDIIAGPLITEDTFDRSGSSGSRAKVRGETPAQGALASGGVSDTPGTLSMPGYPSTPTSPEEADLPSNVLPHSSIPEFVAEPSVTGLPPATEAPPPRTSAGSSMASENELRDNSLLIDTQDGRLRIPLPEDEETSVIANPRANPIAKPGTGFTGTPLRDPSNNQSRKAQETPESHESQKDNLDERNRSESITTRPPPGDPFTARSGASAAARKQQSQPQLSGGDPRTSTDARRASDDLSVVSPLTDPNATQTEAVENTFGPARDPDERAERPNNEVLSPKGDARPMEYMADMDSRDDGLDNTDSEPADHLAPKPGVPSAQRPPGLADRSSEPSGSGEVYDSGKDTGAAYRSPYRGSSRSQLRPNDETAKPLANPMAAPLFRPPGNSPTNPPGNRIPQKPEIYFPTEGDLNPPPGSDQRAKGGTEGPIAPAGDNRRHSPPLLGDSAGASNGGLARRVSASVQVIGSLNNLGLPRGYYIQLASFKDVRKTKQVYQQFVNEYKMNIVPAQIRGQKYYRCLIGNLDESEVASTLRKVRSAGYEDAFVYRN